MRLFGQIERDLAVDFARQAPFVATEVLECCASVNGDGGPGIEFFWNLPVGKRIECLLEAVDWGNGGVIELRFVCQNPGCKQELEIELAVAELAELQSRADSVDRIACQHGGKRFSLRRPTGKDQLAWLTEGFADERQAFAAMARRLLVEDAGGVDELGEGWIEAAGQALEESDPLVDFRVDSACPDCGKGNHFEVDWEAFCLHRLHRAQMNLLEAVHKLAKHYHWSEAQIFAVPAWRRAHYLRLIAKEEDR